MFDFTFLSPDNFLIENCLGDREVKKDKLINTIQYTHAY